MSEQSQRNEMNAAIRAHRERHNVPRSMVGESPEAPSPAAPEPAPEPRKGLLSRLLRK